jgi:nitrite reductase/ring-hydroxylating ferredoxin subunit
MAGHWPDEDALAVGISAGKPFAVSNRCRHLFASLGKGRVTGDGCLQCPWRAALYDVGTGAMVRGPQGAFSPLAGVVEEVLRGVPRLDIGSAGTTATRASTRPRAALCELSNAPSANGERPHRNAHSPEIKRSTARGTRPGATGWSCLPVRPRSPAPKVSGGCVPGL